MIASDAGGENALCIQAEDGKGAVRTIVLKGKGAGFYLDATIKPWSDHYRMYSYITEELPALVSQHFRMDMSRQAVTKHLKVLEEAALVVPIWRGREKLHYLNPVPIHEIAERWIGKFERGRLRALAELKQKLEGESDG